MRIASSQSIVGLLVAMSTLAGCMSAGPGPGGGGGGPIASAPRGVEGDWLSTDGVAISRFSGGVFETIATDTGKKLADGSYKIGVGGTIEITVISLIRQTTTQVACNQVSPTQLNCTSSGGQQFVLTRRMA